MHEGSLSKTVGMPIEESEHHGILKRLKVVFLELISWRVLLLVAEQAVHLLAAQVGVGVQLVHDPISHPLLVHLGFTGCQGEIIIFFQRKDGWWQCSDLSVIDFLFQGVVGDQTIDVGGFGLAIPDDAD